MAVPKKKTSTSKRNMRRSHDKLKPINVIFNKETGEPQLAHQISVDGYYGKRQVVVPKVKKTEEQDQVEEQNKKSEDVVAEDPKDSK
ncbi:MAG: 50S ribosomal protein L32 [Rickettsiales bacterium]|jgi:large subunit ribosomal protein L32|nr:50S ribosomal protein L32 [Rickettsiales bacterium]